MKKLLLLIALALLTFASQGQTDTARTIGDTSFLYLNNQQVGYVNKIRADHGMAEGGIRFMDITLTRALSEAEIESIVPNTRFVIGDILYDFKLPSDYIKQSSLMREVAIKTRITTGIIGTGLGIIGGIMIANPPQNNGSAGIIIGSAGLATLIGGQLFSLKFDIDANKMLRKSSDKLRERGF
jgi:hypothetical protein